MYIYNAFTFLLFVFTSSLAAQNNLEFYAQKAQAISDLTDVNEKKYQLTEFALEFKSYLELEDTTAVVAKNLHIKSTKSIDSKYGLYYFNTIANGVIYRVDWFVIYGDVNKRKVLHSFDDEVASQVKKGKGELKMHLSRKKHSKTDLYPLTISFKDDSKTYKEFPDVAVICQFEELLQRPTAEERMALNDTILNRMQVLWDNPDFFSDKFEGIKRMSTLLSEDGKVKVCTWNLLLPNSTNHFYGAVLVKTKNDLKVSLLNNNTDNIRSPERMALNTKNWYGAIYYDMVEVKDKNKQLYYLLIGYKPNNEMTKKKVVEPMMVSASGQVRFGNSVFQEDRNLYKRLIFEYSAAANMMLRYDKPNKRIVLDHLAPPNTIYSDNKRFYGPDFSYDAYVYNKKKWEIKRDIQVYNPSTGK